jgi:cytochrome bd-type quinol oxidase subunit 2
VKIRPEFRLPIRVTLIAFALAIVLVIAGSTWIYMSETSSRRANRRAEMMGSGLAVLMCVVVAPFWLTAAGKVGKERREQRLVASKQRKRKRSQAE